MIDDGVVQPDGMFRSILYSKLKEKKISTKKLFCFKFSAYSKQRY